RDACEPGLSASAAAVAAPAASADPAIPSAIRPTPGATPFPTRRSSDLTFAVTDTDAGSGMKQIKYTTDGSDPTSSGTATTVAGAGRSSTGATSKEEQWACAGSCRNIQALLSQTVQIDGTAPNAPTLTMT